MALFSVSVFCLTAAGMKFQYQAYIAAEDVLGITPPERYPTVRLIHGNIIVDARSAEIIRKRLKDKIAIDAINSARE